MRHHFLLIALLAIASPRVAEGSPLEDVMLGGAVFTGPTHAHPTSVHLNPAALGVGTVGLHLITSANLRIDRVGVDRLQMDPYSGETTPGSSVTATTMTPSGFVGGYWKGENVAAGFAAYTPMAERFIANEDALRYHTLGGYHYQFGLALGVSIYLQRRYYIGAGLSFMTSAMRFRFARDTALEYGSDDVRGIASDCGNGQPCNFENPEAAERIDVKVATEGSPFAYDEVLDFFNLFGAGNIALSAGILFRLKQDWWLAAAYQGPPGLRSDLSMPGDAKVEGAPRDGGGTYRGDAVINYNLPHTAHLGLRGPVLPDYDLVVNARFQSLDSHEDLDIRMFGGNLADGGVPEWYPRFRGFNWVLRFQAGLESLTSGTFRYGARLSWERGAVTSLPFTPLQVAGQNLSLALGGEVRLGQSIVVGVGYQLAWFPTVNSTDSEFDPRQALACVDSNYDMAICEAARQGRATPTAAGTYRRLQNTLALSLQYDWM